MPEKRRVLLVDDEISIIKMIGKRLEIEGYEVLIAMDGEQALQLARTEHPDIIVLDLMLPKVDGFKICEQLKEKRDAKDIPIITIFSGRGSDDDAQRCKELGAAAYVTKGEGELIVRAGARRRAIALPPRIARLAVESARLEAGSLTVSFAQPEPAGSSRRGSSEARES